MQPTNYILQESPDGINFIDSKDWLTNTPIEYGTASAQQHIYKYRELGITYYFRVKGTSGNATPIYSNIISKFSTDYVKGYGEMNNTGLGYSVGAEGYNMWLAKDKIRHFIKQSNVNVQYAWLSSAKADNFIYFLNITSTSGQTYKYDILNKTISSDFTFGGQYHRFINYHQPTNSLYSIDYSGGLRKRNLTTNNTTLLVNFNVYNSYFFHLIHNNKIYIIGGRFNNLLRIYDINTNTTITKTIPIYNATTTDDQYYPLIHNNKMYLCNIRAGYMYEYDITNETFTQMASGLSPMYLPTVSADGSKIYSPYINKTGIHQFDLVTYANSKISINNPGYKINLLENGKYSIPNDSLSPKGIVWGDGQSLIIDPMNPIYNY
jgi:hypothetical protein